MRRYRASCCAARPHRMLAILQRDLIHFFGSVHKTTSISCLVYPNTCMAFVWGGEEGKFIAFVRTAPFSEHCVQSPQKVPSFLCSGDALVQVGASTLCTELIWGVEKLMLFLAAQLFPSFVSSSQSIQVHFAVKSLGFQFVQLIEKEPLSIFNCCNAKNNI